MTLHAWATRIKQDILTLWFSCRHPDTPWYVKGVCLFVVGYAFSPIDLIPDFIPVLGYLDDVLLLPVFIWLALRLLPSAVLQECRQQASDWAAQRKAKPNNYVAATIIVLVWVVLACLLVQWMLV